MRKHLTACMALMVVLGFAQVPEYNKEYLQEQNAKLARDIQKLSKDLEFSRKESQTSLVYVSQLNDKIQAQDNLVSNLDTEKRFIEDEVYALGKKINVLSAELGGLKKNHKSVLVRAYKNKSTQSRLLFVLSSKSFGEAFRRIKYLDKYSDYQNRKIAEIANKQKAIKTEQAKRKQAKIEKEKLLMKQVVYQEDLELDRQKREAVVAEFKKNQGKIARQISDKRAQQKRIDAQIKGIIENEIRLAKAKEEAERKQREIEEAKRKKELEIAKQKALEEERKRQAEIAKRRAEEEERRKAEQAAKEKERLEEIARINDQREREKQAELAKLEAERERQRLVREAAARRAEEERKRKAAEVAAVEKVEAQPEFAERPAPADLSNDFAVNKGRLPWPVSRGTVVAHFGVNPHPILAGIKIENSGVDIATSRGSKATAVFDGTIAAISVIPGGNKTVLVKHGSYFTVYHNLKDVYVSKGENVSRGKSLGLIDTDSEGQTILNFQVWRQTAKENPANWINGM